MSLSFTHPWDDLYWYSAPHPRTIESNKKRHIKKLLKKTGWLKKSKNIYIYMFNDNK